MDFHALSPDREIKPELDRFYSAMQFPNNAREVLANHVQEGTNLIAVGDVELGLEVLEYVRDTIAAKGSSWKIFNSDDYPASVFEGVRQNNRPQ